MLHRLAYHALYRPLRPRRKLTRARRRAIVSYGLPR